MIKIKQIRMIAYQKIKVYYNVSDLYIIYEEINIGAAMEHKMKDGMIDNRHVKDDHQEGISRVIQRKHDRNDVEGHKGYMGGKVKSDSGFKRTDGSLTPRKA